MNKRKNTAKYTKTAAVLLALSLLWQQAVPLSALAAEESGEESVEEAEGISTEDEIAEESGEEIAEETEEEAAWESEEILEEEGTPDEADSDMEADYESNVTDTDEEVSEIEENETIIEDDAQEEAKEQAESEEQGADTADEAEAFEEAESLEAGETDEWLKSFNVYQMKDAEGNSYLSLVEYTGKVNTVTVSTPVKFEGKSYDRVVVAMEAFKGNSTIKTISLKKGVEFGPYATSIFKDCNNLQQVYLEGLNTSETKDMSGLFEGCSALKSVFGMNTLDTSKVETMKNMFSGCSALYNVVRLIPGVGSSSDCVNLADLNTSGVVDMSGMFNGCSKVESIVGLDNWDTSQVTDMSNMFNGCIALGSLEGPANWQTSKVETMESMFCDCRALTSIDVSKFDVSGVANFANMFSDCGILPAIDCSGWETSSAATMDGMFWGCQKISELNLSGFETENVTNMNRMFYGLDSIEELDISNFSVTPQTDIQYMFAGDARLKKIIASSLWNIRSSDSMTSPKGDNVFLGCSALVGGSGTAYSVGHTNYTYAHFDLGTADPGYFTNSDGSFAYNGFVVKPSGNDILISGFCDDNAEKAVVPAVMEINGKACNTVLQKGVFSNKNKLTNIQFTREKDQPMIRFSEEMYDLFNNCENLLSIEGLNNIDSSAMTNMNFMFYHCEKLKELDLSSWDTGKTKNTKYSFVGCNELKTIIVSEKWSADAITESTMMFFNCPKLTGGCGTAFDANHTNKEYARIDTTENPGYFTLIALKDYAYETKDNELILTDYDGADTDVVVPGRYAFNGMTYHTALSGGVFRDLNYLESINFEDGIIFKENMKMLFYNCKNLKTIKGLAQADTSAVTDMSFMFAGCEVLGGLILIDFDTSNVIVTEGMFSGCTLLKKICVSDMWSMKNVINGSDMFLGCEALVGGSGTEYDANHVDLEYARIDADGTPGYLSGESTLPDELKVDVAQIVSIKPLVPLTYDGKAKMPVPVVYFNGKAADKKYYSLSYSNNINAGTKALLTVRGEGRYKGSKPFYFTINKAAQSINSVPKSKAVVSGQTIAANTVVSWIQPGIKNGVYVFSSNKTGVAAIDKKTGKLTAQKTGTAKITVYIAATDNYNKSASKSFSVKVVVPAQPTLKKAVASKKKIKATWKKQALAGGFIVEYAKDKKFKVGKGSFTVTNTKAKKTSGIGPKKGLSKGKYYVRLYAYGKTKSIKSKPSKKVISVSIK